MSLATLGRHTDRLLDSIPPGTLPACVVGLASLLVLRLYIRFWHVSYEERPATFQWRIPDEAAFGWKGKRLEKPSIDSHLSDSSLLPSEDETRDDLLLSGLPRLDSPSTGTADREYITCYAPSSFYHLGTVPSLGRVEISAAIARAQGAQRSWGKSSWARRRRVLRSLLVWCETESEAIARIASRDTGKTLVDAAFGEILTTCEKLRWTIANAERELAPDTSRGTNLLLAHKQSEVRYEPKGVVAAIVSWNYPAHNALSPLISSLATGNAIVIKPSELVAWSTLHYIRAVKACLVACGEDPELVQCVVTRPRDVEALTGNERVKHITFIGSEQVGSLVAQKAAEVGTPVLLELGGKDPCIVLESADCEFFKHTWMRGVFQSMSQNCIGIERFIVHASHASFFRSTMGDMVRSIQLGDVMSCKPSRAASDKNNEAPRVDAGAMVSDRLFDELEQLVREAVKDGAELVCGGKRKGSTDTGGHWFEPTLLVDVTPNMRIAQQEVFAPIMLVMTYRGDVKDAIRLANGTRYGLGASVFGRDKKQCDQVVEGLECGMVCTNDFGVFYLNQGLPFGGVKASGYGRFAGREGLHGLCNIKAVTRDRFHGVVQTSIPPLLRYPLNSGEGAWKFVRGLVAFAYADTVAQRLSGMWALISAK